MDHDKHTLDYDELAGRVDQSHKRMAALLGEKVRAGDCVLDVGCGTGLVTSWLHERGVTVDGIDISSTMLRKFEAKRTARHLVPHDLNAEDWPVPPKAYQHVVANGVLNFIEDPAMFINEIHRACADQAYCFLSYEEPFGQKQVDYIEHDGRMIAADAHKLGITAYVWPSETILKALEQAGFTVLTSLRERAFTSPSTNREVMFCYVVAQLTQD